MSEMKLCPFCGWEFAEHAWNEFGEEYRVCDQCGASSGTVDSKWDWQSRPIEDELRKRIAELESARRWRVVADGELPDDDVEVFVLLYGSSVSTGKHYRNARHLDLEDNSYDLNYVIGDYWLIGDDEITCAQHCYNAVTHWMPLPQPPEVQESEATSCKFCGSNKSDIRMNSIVCSSCGRKIGNVAPPEVQA